MTQEIERLRAELEEWRQRAEACTHGESAFRTLFDLAGVGIGQVRVPDGVVERCNPKLLTILGCDAGDLLGHPFLDFVHPEDREALWREFLRLIDSEVAEAHRESRFVHGDGSFGWASVNATVYRDPADGTRHVIGTIQEITDRVQADAALRRSEATLRLLTDNIDDVFWMTAPDQSRVLYVSSAFERIWGGDRERLYREPRYFLDLVHPDDRRALMEADPRSASEYLEREYRIINARGHERWIRDRAFPVRNGHDGVEYVAGIATDVTEHKQADLHAAESSRRLASANQELERFALAVAHDLKAPLRSVSGLLGVIAEDFCGDVAPEAVQRMNKVRERVVQMDRLIGDLLQYARAGLTTGPRQYVPVRDLVAAQVAAMNVPPAFRVHIADDLPTLETYAAALAQVFANLIGNAIRHHVRPDGQCWVSARDAGEYVEFTVSDDGPGIPPAEWERVFDMFYSLKPKEPESTGIGLALVKRIVESAGGRIRLDRGLAGGSAFTFAWPKRIAET